MNYSTLFLSNESIQGVFKDKQQKSTASHVKVVPKKGFAEKCEKCDYKTSVGSYMYKHNRIKHSDIKHKCTECSFTHTFPTKVRTHYRQVHLGVPRNKTNKQTKQKCRKLNCKDVGKLDCKELLHFLLFCDQCDFSTNRNDALKIHINRVHEGLLESFPCNQCDFITNLKSSLKKHTSGKHTTESMRERHTCDYEGCTYKTFYKSGLRPHIETKHEGIVRFRCEFMNCTFGTNKRKKLIGHTIMHTISTESQKNVKTDSGEKSNKCDKTYSGEKSNKCNQCDSAFSRASSLRRHLKIHSGEKTNKCNLCGYASFRAGSLRMHAKMHSAE